MSYFKKKLHLHNVCIHIFFKNRLKMNVSERIKIKVNSVTLEGIIHFVKNLCRQIIMVAFIYAFDKIESKQKRYLRKYNFLKTKNGLI